MPRRMKRETTEKTDENAKLQRPLAAGDGGDKLTGAVTGPPSTSRSDSGPSSRRIFSRATPAPEDAAAWRARKARAEALLAERRLAEEEGRLLPKDAVTAGVRLLAATVLAEVRREPLMSGPGWQAIEAALPAAVTSMLRHHAADWERRLLQRLAEIPVASLLQGGGES